MNTPNNKEQAATDSFMKKGHQSIMETLYKGMETVEEELKNYAKITFKFCKGLEYGYTICPFNEVGSQLEAVRSNFEDYNQTEDNEYGKPEITITPVQLTDKEFEVEFNSWG